MSKMPLYNVRKDIMTFAIMDDYYNKVFQSSFNDLCFHLVLDRPTPYQNVEKYLTYLTNLYDLIDPQWKTILQQFKQECQEIWGYDQELMKILNKYEMLNG